MGGKKRIKDDIDFYKKLGDKIKNIRLKENLTQKELGDYLGVSNQTIARYEKGNISIPFCSIVKLCEFFKVSVNYFAVQLGSEEDIKGFLSVPNTMDVLKTVVNNIDILKHIINKDI